MIKKGTNTEQIETIAFKLLENNPEGIRWSLLNAKIKESDPSFHPKTINGLVWTLPVKYPEKVYKPARGIFRLLKYK